MAEAATVQLEMKYLSYLTGDESYWRKSEAVLKVLDDQAAQDGLLPIFVHPETGRFTTREIRLGSRGDSYYGENPISSTLACQDSFADSKVEYLVKQYLQTSEPVYLEMWAEALQGIQKRLIVSTQHSGLKVVAELPQGVGGQVLPKMDHLVCFLPGTIALGATGGLTLEKARKTGHWSAEKEEQIILARDLMKTCWGMYAVTETGLAPEIAFFNIAAKDAKRPRTSDRLASWKKDYIIKPLDAHNLQRPETVESLFMMWRITENPLYREWGWKIFQAFKQHTAVGDGKGPYTSVNNVNAVPPVWRDNMESFWLVSGFFYTFVFTLRTKLTLVQAETLKYLYLLFSPNDFIPLEEVVFNTEAHIFPRFKDEKWGTGWRRNRATS